MCFSVTACEFRALLALLRQPRHSPAVLVSAARAVERRYENF